MESANERLFKAAITGDAQVLKQLMAGEVEDGEFFLRGARLLSEHFQGFSYDNENYARLRDSTRAIFLPVNDKSLLYMAAEKGYVEAASLFLENKAFSYVSVGREVLQGPNGSTALHIATCSGNYG